MKDLDNIGNGDPRRSLAFVESQILEAMRNTVTAYDTLRAADALFHVRLKWLGVISEHDRRRQESCNFAAIDGGQDEAD